MDSDTNDKSSSWRDAVPAVAVAISAISVICTGIVASCTLRTSSEMPFRATLYTERVKAMQSYANAFQQYFSALEFARLDLPYDVSSPAALSATADKAMWENAQVGRRIILARASYMAAVDGVKALWPVETRNQIAETAEAGGLAGKCFFTLGSHIRPMNAAYWQTVRERAAVDCLNLNEHEAAIAFDSASRNTIAKMQDNLTSDQRDMVPRD